MIKTIKVKKSFRLDELIKYARDNGVKSQAFVDDAGRASVYFGSEQRISFGEYGYGDFGIDRTFTVEVEEEITEDKVFEDITVVCKINSRDETGHFYNSTLKDIKKAKNLLSAYIPIGGKLQLIWEADSDELREQRIYPTVF